MLTSLLHRLETAHYLRPDPRARLIGLALIATSAAASLAALMFFATPVPGPGWTPYLVGVAFFMAAIYVLFRNPPVTLAAPAITWPVGAGLVVIILIAAGLRYFDLNNLPFGTWWDEADISNVARQVLVDPDYRPVFVISNDHALPFFAVAAIFFNFLGASTWALRVVTATYGVLTVIPAFLLGRELYGNRFGLTLAFLFAVARWDITFSRFAIYAVTLPFFEVLALWLMMRARRTHRVQDFAWAGFAIGFGLFFHISFRLFPVVAVVFFVWWAISFWREHASEPNRGTRLAVNLSVLTLATTLTFAPVIQFAIQRPDIYWGRARTVSIFSQRDEPNLAKALWDNSLRHLFMFNYRGDRNGRHNLPGAPMLDPFTGALFVVGAALAVSRLRHLPNVTFILIFVLGLSAGILTLDFEAPQANRAIGALTGALYFAALALETVWRAIDSASISPTTRQGLALALIVGLGGATLYSNAYTYFVTQAKSDDVWLEHNGVESLTARKMQELDPATTSIYASVFLNNHLVIQFLAPHVTNSQALIPPIGLPVREPGDKAVAIFVDQSNTWIVDQARRLYPNARFDTYTTPMGRPVLQTIRLSPEDVQSVQGLTASYWLGDTPDGQPSLTRSEKAIAANWPAEAPLGEPFVVQWSGCLYAPAYGDYEIEVQSPSGATLWIDEQQILNGAGLSTATLRLAQGDHALRLMAQSSSGDVRLGWRTPTSGTGQVETVQSQWLYITPPACNHGLQGAYYGNPDWSGEPNFTRVDPFLDTYFHLIPLARPYTVDWSGQIDIPADGEYAFGLRINGQAQVFIDDQLIVDAPQPAEYVEGATMLTAGRHKIRVRYLDNVGGSRIHLYWTPPGTSDRQIVPSEALWPYPQP